MGGGLQDAAEAQHALLPARVEGVDAGDEGRALDGGEEGEEDKLDPDWVERDRFNHRKNKLFGITEWL